MLKGLDYQEVNPGQDQDSTPSNPAKSIRSSLKLVSPHELGTSEKESGKNGHETVRVVTSQPTDTSIETIV